MDKKIIKNHLNARFLTEESTPGIDVTKKANKESGKINKAAVKDMDKNAANYEKAITKTDKSTKIPANKFNYNSDKEKVYHDEMEIRNGQEMIQYDRDPNQEYKDRATEAIEGSSRMGNNPEWANVVPQQKGFTGPTFGKNLVKTIKDASKKREDAEYKVISFGNDIETVPKGSKPMAKHSALSEGKEQDIEANSFSDNIQPLPKGEKQTPKHPKFDSLKEDKKDNPDDMSQSDASGDDYERIEREYQKENKNNNKPKIKEGMKRLNFKKEFNGVGNALKMIPEGYKVDNKVFEMTDGNESYKIRWEGTLSEGKATILTASNKTMVNEDMQKMKHLMGYKSEKTLGLVKGNARLNENAIFNDIYTKTKALLEGEDIDGQTAPEGDFDKIKKKAPEATKHIEGTTSTDKGTKAPKPKTGNFEEIKKSAPEATKHVEGSVSTDKGTKAPKPKTGEWSDIKKKAPEATKHVKEGAEIGIGLGDQAEGEGDWDLDLPQAAAHGNPSSTTYAPAPKTGEWDKISVPQAADAKKHVSMSEGVTLGGVYYGPIAEKKK